MHRGSFISLILSYKVSKNTTLIRCTANQASTGHKLHFQHKHPARTKMAAINNRHGCGTAEVRWRYFKSISYHWYYHILSGKINLCSVVTPTKSAQAISSIFTHNVQHRPNLQQSTTKMSVTRLRCNADSSEVFYIIYTII